MNRLYIYRKKTRSKWITVGWFCIHCGRHTFEKQLKLMESLRVRSEVSD